MKTCKIKLIKREIILIAVYIAYWIKKKNAQNSLQLQMLLARIITLVAAFQKTRKKN